MHAKHKHNRALDRERLHVQHQLLPRGNAVSLGEGRESCWSSLPRQPFGDGTLFGHRHRRIRQPVSMGSKAGRRILTSCIRKARQSGRSTSHSRCHPYIIGRPGRTTVAMRGIIQHMKKAGSVWFPTGMELADYCLNNVFKADAKSFARPPAERRVGSRHRCNRICRRRGDACRFDGRIEPGGTVEDFYRGKTIRILIGYGPGGDRHLCPLGGGVPVPAFARPADHRGPEHAGRREFCGREIHSRSRP